MSQLGRGRALGHRTPRRGIAMDLFGRNGLWSHWDQVFLPRRKGFVGQFSDGLALEQAGQIALKACGLTDEAAAQARQGVDGPHAKIAAKAQNWIIV